MKEVVVNVYEVNELSQQAQEKAYGEWLQSYGSDYGWTTENEATLKAFQAIFPVYVTYFQYDEYRGYVRFTFAEDENIENLCGIRLATYIYNNYYDRITKGRYYSLWSKTEKNEHGNAKLKCRHSKVLFEKYDCALTGYYIDNAILSPLFDFLKNPNPYTTFRELMEICFQSWAKFCSEDYSHAISFECFLDEASNNGYEYYEDGSRFMVRSA